MKALAGIACLLIVAGMGFVGAYQLGRERGIIVGACAVVKTMRADIDWSKDCR